MNNMALNIASINSGSNGNCYYIGNDHDAVLVDAGISCKETEKRLSRMGLSFDKIRAVFISHEHTDHTRRVDVIARRFQIPVYFSPIAYNKSKIHLDDHLLAYINDGSEIKIGSLLIKAFSKLHDSSDPLSFTVSSENVNVGVYTDIGMVTEPLVQHFSQCNAAFLESNYDEEMLENGRYPVFLKNRIRGDHGHLSNMQALDLFRNHKSPSLSHVLLSHLSQDNNNPELARDLFLKHANGTEIAIASRYQESEVYCIKPATSQA